MAFGKARKLPDWKELQQRFVTLREPANADRVWQLTALKPHIALQEAQAAVSEVDLIIPEVGHQYPAKVRAQEFPRTVVLREQIDISTVQIRNQA